MSASFGDGRYRVVSVLGRGAFAEVFEVEDTRLGVRRALKCLHAELTTDAVARARFATEAQVMARLSHPHLVTVTDVGEDAAPDGTARVWFVMELLPGGTLAEAIARDGPADPVEAARAMLGVIDAVGLAHRSGVIHRDIKPANLLRDAEGRLKLGDFGIAQLRSPDDLTRTGVALGSWAFMAPEQRLDARGVGPASDVYGLAATLVWMIRGEAVSDLHVTEHRARLLGGVPDAIAGALSRALAFRPEERFHRAEAFGEVLGIAAGAGGGGAGAVAEGGYGDAWGGGEPAPRDGALLPLGGGGSRGGWCRWGWRPSLRWARGRCRGRSPTRCAGHASGRRCPPVPMRRRCGTGRTRRDSRRAPAAASRGAAGA